MHRHAHIGRSGGWCPVNGKWSGHCASSGRSFVHLFVSSCVDEQEWVAFGSSCTWLLPHGRRDNGPVPQPTLYRPTMSISCKRGWKQTHYQFTIPWCSFHNVFANTLPASHPVQRLGSTCTCTYIYEIGCRNAYTRSLYSSADSHNIRKKKNRWQDRKYFVSSRTVQVMQNNERGAEGTGTGTGKSAVELSETTLALLFCSCTFMCIVKWDINCRRYGDVYDFPRAPGISLFKPSSSSPTRVLRLLGRAGSPLSYSSPPFLVGLGRKLFSP